MSCGEEDQAIPGALGAGYAVDEQIIIGDHKRLWATNFLDDLSAEVHDVRFANGVIGKVVRLRVLDNKVPRQTTLYGVRWEFWN